MHMSFSVVLAQFMFNYLYVYISFGQIHRNVG
jgi:hypothetical protein